jgi:hypothetical protein
MSAKLIAEPADAGEAPTLEDDDLDADLVPTPDSALPLPDVEGVARYWDAHQAAFTADGRYLGGRPCDTAALRSALVLGPCRRRREIARELAIRSAGAFRVNTRAFASEQRRQLAHMAALTPAALVRIAGWAPLF